MFDLIYQRMHRNPVFDKPSIDQRRKKVAYSVTTPDAMSLQTGKRQCLYGALYEDKNGNHVIDAPGGQCRIEFSPEAEISEGFFTLCCFVLAEGVWDPEREVFVVEEMAFPPKEPRLRTVSDFPALNFVPTEQAAKRAELEK